MYCQKCGIEINENQKTCQNCGSENLVYNKFSGKRKWIIIGVIVMIIALFIGLLIFNNIKVQKHKELIQKVSETQLDLYQHKLIPTLMGDAPYSIKDVKCSEVSSEGKAQYAIGMDCTITIGDKTFQYPIAVLFNEDNIDKPQYVHDTGIEKQIIDYEKEYKTEQEKKNRANEVVTISSKDLYNVYDKNEVDAENKYSGKTGMITGRISSIDITGGKPSVKLIGIDSMSGVICYFDDNSQSSKISKLKKGQTITIRGKIRGKGILSVCIDDSMVW